MLQDVRKPTSMTAGRQFDRVSEATKADIDRLAHKFEAMLWKRTVAIVVTLVGTQVAVYAAVVGILLGFLR